MCVCEREKMSESLCVKESLCERETKSECEHDCFDTGVRVKEKERERVCVCERESAIP